ncbi:metallophosphatase family protein [Patescibacteria group bacterium]|nr:metallophosphatase family protein [Patescibacteria group bacterium]
MKIAIVSDTHDNLKNLRRFLSFVKKERVKIIIHCGDVSRGETLKEIRKNFKGDFFLSIGNADFKDSIMKYKDICKVKTFEDFGEFIIDGLKIGFCHFIDLAKTACQNKRYDFVFYGHIHRPWLEIINNCILANPGSIAGYDFAPLISFAILETKKKKLSLILLEKIEKSA